MKRGLCLFAGLLCGSGLMAQEEVVFRSDVALVRVDAQVVDRSNRAIDGLSAEDFVLLEEGREQQIRNFATEEVPVDVLLLLDVSGSMRTHVERIASAAERALMALGEGDRVAVMVFDRETRVRLPFRSDRGQVEAALNAVLSQEGFNGGTDITRALYDAASFVARDARREARRAIVILTDDQTERGRDEAGVTRALTQGDVVLSALLTPDAVGMSSPAPWPGTLGDILLGRGPMGRRGPVRIGGRTQSAGTAEIAQRSGGDSMRVNEASAFETTLARIRQRYALHFYLPDGAQPGEERSVEVELAGAARRRYPDAQVRYRRVYLTPGSLGEPTVASAAPPQESAPVVNAEQPRAEPPDNDQPRVEQPRRRRPAVNEPGSSGGWRRVDEPERAPAPEAKAEEKPAQSGGWRRLKPGEQP